MPAEGVVAVKYTVKAKHWEKGWELHIADIGVTQVRTLDAARQQVADYIDTLLDLKVGLDNIEIVPQLADKMLVIEVRKARDDLRQAVDNLARAAAQQRQVAARLRREAHLSVSDTATLMEISRGRVSQLTADTDRTANRGTSVKA